MAFVCVGSLPRKHNVAIGVKIVVDPAAIAVDETQKLEVKLYFLGDFTRGHIHDVLIDSDSNLVNDRGRQNCHKTGKQKHEVRRPTHGHNSDYDQLTIFKDDSS